MEVVWVFYFDFDKLLRISTAREWKKAYTEPIFELKMKNDLASCVPISPRQDKEKIIIKENDKEKKAID